MKGHRHTRAPHHWATLPSVFLLLFYERLSREVTQVQLVLILQSRLALNSWSSCLSFLYSWNRTALPGPICPFFTCIYTPWLTGGVQRTTWMSRFSPSSMWNPPNQVQVVRLGGKSLFTSRWPSFVCFLITSLTELSLYTLLGEL